MSGIGFWEFIFLCMIGLIVLGPKRLPAVANQLGAWVGQARRMTRTLKRQLEEELDLDKELNVRPRIAPFDHPAPRDDDNYSPLHSDAASDRALGASTSATDRSAEDGAVEDVPREDEAKRRSGDEAKHEG